jgi:hypothetical protein
MDSYGGFTYVKAKQIKQYFLFALIPIPLVMGLLKKQHHIIKKINNLGKKQTQTLAKKLALQVNIRPFN